MRLFFFAAFFLPAMLASVEASALRLSPKFKPEAMASSHFEIFFAKGQKKLAERYLTAAEKAYELLLPIFREAPAKTLIILRDDTDFSNGYANFLPFPHIVIFPVLPSPSDSIDDYGDWPLEMMIHEYTHILNVFSAHGLYRPLTWVFGNLVRPNAVLPRWYLEGLAVNLESRLTNHGRLRSIETRASARALVLENKLGEQSIAHINETGLAGWPFGNRPYLYGGWWWDHVHREKGPEVIYTWNQNFSRRLPFLMDGPVKEQTGKSAAGNLEAAFQRLSERAQSELDKLKTQTPHPATPLATDKGELAAYALSPSGDKLAYWTFTPGQGTFARLKARTHPKQSFADLEPTQLLRSSGTSKVRWIDEDNLLFDHVDIQNPYADFRDLYRFNIAIKRWTRLTWGARASEPALSPSGQQIAFIQSDAGKNHLALLDRISRKIRRLVSGRLNQRLSSPEFLSDSEILYIHRDESGVERIQVYDTQVNLPAPWSKSEFKAAQSLRKTSAGLLVTNAKGGVRNLYLFNSQGQWKPVTHTLTQVDAGDFDSQREEILFSELTGSGRQLRSTPLAEFMTVDLEPLDFPLAPKASDTHFEVRDLNYRPLHYMWPRYWVPFIFQVENGFILQGLTSASDPIGRNQYSLLGSYDTITQQGSYGASFTNRSLVTDLNAQYSKSLSYLGASGVTIETHAAELGASGPLFARRELVGELAGQWLSTHQTSSDLRRLGPQASLMYSRMDGPEVDRFGWHAELNHSEFFAQPGYLAYGRTYAHLASNIKLRGGHRLSLQGRGSLAPRMPFQQVVTLGDRNLGGNLLVNLANSQFLLRGYPSGTFVGRKMVSANAEYILPAWELARGYGMLPFFLKNLELALFTDALSVDGAGFSSISDRYLRSHLSEFYLGSGAEFRFNATAAYHLPVSLTLGLYYGLNDRFGGGFSPFLGIGLGDLSSLSF